MARVVDFSSELNNTTYSASLLPGAPAVYPQYDPHGAWLTRYGDDTKQWVEVEFAHPVRPTHLHIYETCRAGAVMSVKARRAGHWETVWSKDKPGCIQAS